MIILENLPADEAERLAYAEGFPGVAKLYARIAELEDTLRMALPFVEDGENDPAYKKSAVRSIVRKIRKALGEPT